MYTLKIDEVPPELEKAIQALIQENRLYACQTTMSWCNTVEIELTCRDYSAFRDLVSVLDEIEFYRNEIRT